MRKRSSKICPLKIVAVERVGAVLCLDPDFDAIMMGCNTNHAVLPAQVEAARQQGVGFGDEDLLGEVLLQIDEGGKTMAAFGQQIEFVQQAVAMENLAEVPGDAAGQHALGASEAVEDFEGALGPADRPAAGADGVVLIEQHGRYPATHEIHGDRESDRAAPRDDHRMARRLRFALIRMRAIVELGRGNAHGLILTRGKRTCIS